MAYEYEVETPIGKLVVEPTGDTGIYDGLMVSLLKPNGEIGTIAWVEVETLGNGGHEVHTLAFDGNDQEPTKIICDPDGDEMSYR